MIASIDYRVTQLCSPDEDLEQPEITPKSALISLTVLQNPIPNTTLAGLPDFPSSGFSLSCSLGSRALLATDDFKPQSVIQRKLSL